MTAHTCGIYTPACHAGEMPCGMYASAHHAGCMILSHREIGNILETGTFRGLEDPREGPENLQDAGKGRQRKYGICTDTGEGHAGLPAGGYGPETACARSDP